MGSVLCEHCAGACCRYIALPIDKPRRARDYDDIRWYLMHEGVSVFVEEGDWYIQFQTRCKNLREDHLCGVYDHRPHICREYEPGSCDYADGDFPYDHLFTHPRQIEEFYANRTGKKLVDRRTTGAQRKPRGPRRKDGRLELVQLGTG